MAASLSFTGRQTRPAGVVGEVRMLVCPVPRGKGTRIFENRQDPLLLEATSFENAVAILRYEIQR
jgi:hypothetical protein